MLDQGVEACLRDTAAAARGLRLELATLVDTIMEHLDPAGVDVLGERAHEQLDLAGPSSAAPGIANSSEILPGLLPSHARLFRDDEATLRRQDENQRYVDAT